MRLALLIGLSGASLAMAATQWPKDDRLKSYHHSLRVTMEGEHPNGVVLLKRTEKRVSDYYTTVFNEQGQEDAKAIGSIAFQKRYTDFQKWFELMRKKYESVGQCEFRLAVSVSTDKKPVHADSICLDRFTEEDHRWLGKWLDQFRGELSRVRRKSSRAKY